MVRMPLNNGGVNQKNRTRTIPRNVCCRTHNTCPVAVLRTMIVYTMRDEPVAARLKEARMAHLPTMDELLTRITIDPDICHGKPCIRGLRYPVEIMLELLTSGMTMDDILEDYDDLEREDLYAVLAYATRLSQIKRVQAIAA